METRNRRNNTTAILVMIMLCAILCAVVAGVDNVAIAEESLDIEMFDKMFIRTLRELSLIGENVVYTRRALYDLDEKVLGYIYDYNVFEKHGYAVVILTKDGLRVTEVCPNALSPYINLNCLPVYISEFNHWGKSDNVFISLSSQEEVLYDDMKTLYPNFYQAGGDNLSNLQETIFYDEKHEESYNLALTIPAFSYSSLENACVPIAGGNIIVYFDRYCPNLITNYTPGFGIGTIYKYYTANNAYVATMIRQLSIDMGTNESGEGNSVSEFKSGMEKYCERSGYSFQTISCMNGNNLDYNKAKSALQDDGLPIIMFLQRLQLSSIEEMTNADKYESRFGDISHALSAFGYREITYRIDSDVVRTERFLHVASGISSFQDVYLNVENNLMVDDAYIIQIA